MSTNYPILVCDDDQDLANKLAQSINNTIQNLTDDDSSYKNLKEYVLFIASSFEQTVSYITTNNIKNGIYFLDIELSQTSKAKNGVDLAEVIKKEDENAQIIFVTAYDKYAPLTYRRRIGAIDYINKNLSQFEMMQRLQETLHNALDNLTNIVKYQCECFSYKVGQRVFKINQNDIIFIENSLIQHKVHMITENGETEFKGNIGQLEKDTPFLVKVSQSYLVNPVNISSIDLKTQTIVFDNQMKINYSRTYKKTVKEKLLNKFSNILIQ